MNMYLRAVHFTQFGQFLLEIGYSSLFGQFQLVLEGVSILY